MTYEEMEMLIFNDNTDPIPGSWRDEVIKGAMGLHERKQDYALGVFIVMARKTRRDMLDKIWTGESGEKWRIDGDE